VAVVDLGWRGCCARGFRASHNEVSREHLPSGGPPSRLGLDEPDASRERGPACGGYPRKPSQDVMRRGEAALGAGSAKRTRFVAERERCGANP
jgi:hypothetical protein